MKTQDFPEDSVGLCMGREASQPLGFHRPGLISSAEVSPGSQESKLLTVFIQPIIVHWCLSSCPSCRQSSFILFQQPQNGTPASMLKARVSTKHHLNQTWVRELDKNGWIFHISEAGEPDFIREESWSKTPLQLDMLPKYNGRTGRG